MYCISHRILILTKYLIFVVLTASMTSSRSRACILRSSLLHICPKFTSKQSLGRLLTIEQYLEYPSKRDGSNWRPPIELSSSFRVKKENDLFRLFPKISVKPIRPGFTAGILKWKRKLKCFQLFFKKSKKGNSQYKWLVS